MSKIIKTFAQSPDVIKDFQTYCVRSKINANDFLTKVPLQTQLFFFIEFFAKQYNVSMSFNKYGYLILRNTLIVDTILTKESHSKQIEDAIVYLIIYAQTPF